MDLGEWHEAIFLAARPGRLTEVLIPGVKVRLRPATGGKRRTAWSMIGVECPQGDGLALFPDAPTSRGTRHVEELIGAKRDGFRACLVMAVKHPASRLFRPNRATDPAFAEALYRAVAVGVEVLAYHAPWRGREIRLGKRLPIEIDGGPDGYP